MKNYILIMCSLFLMFGLAGCEEKLEVSDLEPAISEALGVGTIGLNTSVQDTIAVILNSFSTKEFMEKEVSPEDIELIIKSGAKAPSARNLQPWHFTVVTNAEMISKLNGTQGTVFIVISGLTEEIEGVNPEFDCGLATQNMYIAAQSLGLGAHIYAAPISHINNYEKENLGIPENYDAIALMCVGYIENESEAIGSATPRNDLSEIVNYVDNSKTISQTPDMHRPQGTPEGADDTSSAPEENTNRGKITKEQANEMISQLEDMEKSQSLSEEPSSSDEVEADSE